MYQATMPQTLAQPPPTLQVCSHHPVSQTSYCLLQEKAQGKPWEVCTWVSSSLSLFRIKLWKWSIYNVNGFLQFPDWIVTAWTWDISSVSHQFLIPNTAKNMFVLWNKHTVSSIPSHISQTSFFLLLKSDSLWGSHYRYITTEMLLKTKHLPWRILFAWVGAAMGKSL